MDGAVAPQHVADPGGDRLAGPLVLVAEAAPARRRERLPSMIVGAPYPEPTSATRPPARSRSAIPGSRSTAPASTAGGSRVRVSAAVPCHYVASRRSQPYPCPARKARSNSANPAPIEANIDRHASAIAPPGACSSATATGSGSANRSVAGS